MARADARLAAGAGVIAASLLLAGPTVAPASAEPDRDRPGHGHSGNGSGNSDRGRDSGRDRDSGRGDRGDHDGRDDDRRGDDRRGDDRRGDDRGRDGGRDGRADRGDRGSWPSRRGDDESDYWDDEQSRQGDDDADSGESGREALTAPAARSSLGIASESSDSSDFGVASVPDAVEPTPLVPASPSAAPTVGGGGGGGALATNGVLASPLVTFGNGRTPGLLSRRSGRVQLAAGAVPPAAEPVPVIVAAPALPPPSAPGPGQIIPLSDEQRGPAYIEGLWAPIQPAFPGGLLFGIAGLVLMPLAGVWLGYRQARASRAASELVEQ